MIITKESRETTFFVSEAVPCPAKGKCDLILRHFSVRLAYRCCHLHFVLFSSLWLCAKWENIFFKKNNNSQLLQRS